MWDVLLMEQHLAGTRVLSLCEPERGQICELAYLRVGKQESILVESYQRLARIVGEMKQKWAENRRISGNSPM
jgi:hypothetical protein